MIVLLILLVLLLVHGVDDVDDDVFCLVGVTDGGVLFKMMIVKRSTCHTTHTTQDVSHHTTCMTTKHRRTPDHKHTTCMTPPLPPSLHSTSVQQADLHHSYWFYHPVYAI